MQAPSEEDVARQEAIKRRLEDHTHWKRVFFQSRPPPVFVPNPRRRREAIASAPVHIFYKRALELLSSENKPSSALPPPGTVVVDEKTGPAHRKDVWAQQMAREMSSRDPYIDVNVCTDPRRTVVLSGLHRESVEEDIRLFGEQFGCVVSVRLIRDRKGRSRGYGFVQYRLEAEAHKAVGNSRKRRLHGHAVVMEMERGRLDANFLPKRMAEAQRYRETASSSLQSSTFSKRKHQRNECDECPPAEAGVHELTVPVDTSRDDVDALLDDIMNLT